MENKLIYSKMSLVMRDVGSIAKEQTNSAQGFKFRGIDQFVNALYPALTKHGVFMAPALVSESHELKDVIRSNGKAAIDKHVHIQMKYTFYAEDGSFVEVGPLPAEGLDSGDKATNKALSAALKYALIQTFSIPTVDMAEGDLDTPVIGTSTGKTVNSITVNANATSGYVQASTTQLGATNTIHASNVTEQLLATVPQNVSSFRKPKKAVEASAIVNATTTGESSGWDT